MTHNTATSVEKQKNITITSCSAEDPVHEKKFKCAYSKYQTGAVFRLFLKYNVERNLLRPFNMHNQTSRGKKKKDWWWEVPA